MTYDIENTDKFGSLLCAGSTLSTQTLVDDSDEPLRG